MWNPHAICDAFPVSFILSSFKNCSIFLLYFSSLKFIISFLKSSSTDMYRRAFWYTGEILECGTPRMDQLLKQKTVVKNQIRKQ